ncbi:MAG TPA: molybdate ABC transporter substrate-binding protein [Vulgatibacter sp.]
MTERNPPTRRTLSHFRLPWIALLALLACSACWERTTASARIVVFAASSLREAFESIGAEFERSHPGVAVSFNFAGTQELRSQLEHGARADVFASADPHHMDALVAADLVASPAIFATNEPVIVSSRDGGVRSLADLAVADRIVLGAPEVPIGRYAAGILERAQARMGDDFRARVEARVVSREFNVGQVLAKVELGEAQAGIVYRTDARRGSGRIAVVAIPADLIVEARYPIAVTKDASHAELARAFVELALSDAGRRALEGAGFGTP